MPDGVRCRRAARAVGEKGFLPPLVPEGSKMAVSGPTSSMSGQVVGLPPVAGATSGDKGDQKDPVARAKNPHFLPPF